MIKYCTSALISGLFTNGYNAVQNLFWRLDKQVKELLNTLLYLACFKDKFISKSLPILQKNILRCLSLANAVLLRRIMSADTPYPPILTHAYKLKNHWKTNPFLDGLSKI